MTFRKSYRSSFESLSIVAKDLEAFCARAGVDESVSYAFELCLDELFTNIVSYGYGDGNDGFIDLELSVSGGMMNAVVMDGAREFDPFGQAQAPDLNKPLEDRNIGGLGIFFIKKTMDKVSYSRDGNRNVVCLSKRLGTALESCV